MATLHDQLLAGGVDTARVTIPVPDAEVSIVPGRLAQIGAVLFDVAVQQIGDRHARIRRFDLAADHRDARGLVHRSQCLGGSDARRPGTQYDIIHGRPP